jgi:S1-C subfamily serine protease
MPEIKIPDLPNLPQLMNLQGPMLGIDGESLTPQLGEFFGAKEGVLVRSVGRNSAAEKAGIKAGDVIVKVDDSTVTSTREIASVLRSLRLKKKTFPVVVVREKKETTLTVTLEDTPGPAFRAEKVRALEEKREIIRQKMERAAKRLQEKLAIQI